MIDRAAKEQLGGINLSEIIQTLWDQDPWFEYLSHQQLSGWWDKAQSTKIVWSEKTLEHVKKGFLPGGDQTCHNVFVSFLLMCTGPELIM